MSSSSDDSINSYDVNNNSSDDDQQGGGGGGQNESSIKALPRVSEQEKKLNESEEIVSLELKKKFSVLHCHKAHLRDIRGVVFIRDSHIVTGSDSNEIKIWKIIHNHKKEQQQQQKQENKGGEENNNNNNNNNNNDVGDYNLECVLTQETPDPWNYVALASSPRGLLSCPVTPKDHKQNIRLYVRDADTPEFDIIATLSASDNVSSGARMQVTCFRYGDAKLAAGGFQNSKDFLIWDLSGTVSKREEAQKKKIPVATQSPPILFHGTTIKGDLDSLQFSTDNSKFLTATYGHSIEVFDASEKKFIRTLVIDFSSQVYQAILLDDMKTICATGDSVNVRIYSGLKFSEILHDEQEAFSEASSEAGQKNKFYEALDKTSLVNPSARAFEMRMADMAGRGPILLATTERGHLTAFDVKEKKMISRYDFFNPSTNPNNPAIWGLAVSRSGSMVAVGDQHGVLRLLKSPFANYYQARRHWLLMNHGKSSGMIGKLVETHFSVFVLVTLYSSPHLLRDD